MTPCRGEQKSSAVAETTAELSFLGSDPKGTPKGIRTPVAGLRTRSPGPLDDGGNCGKSIPARLRMSNRRDLGFDTVVADDVRPRFRCRLRFPDPDGEMPPTAALDPARSPGPPALLAPGPLRKCRGVFLPPLVTGDRCTAVESTCDLDRRVTYPRATRVDARGVNTLRVTNGPARTCSHSTERGAFQFGWPRSLRVPLPALYFTGERWKCTCRHSPCTFCQMRVSSVPRELGCPFASTYCVRRK